MMLFGDVRKYGLVGGSPLLGQALTHTTRYSLSLSLSLSLSVSLSVMPTVVCNLANDMTPYHPAPAAMLSVMPHLIPMS